jgi:hypothetical protein
VRKQEKVGYATILVAVLLGALGTVGFSLEGEINDIATPTVPERTFFADESLPEHGFTLFVSATLTLNWDRNDIYVVIVDEDEKKTCESQPPGIFNEGTTTACTPYDADVVAGATNGVEGLVWEVSEGVYYAGIGTFDDDGLPDGTEVNLAYEVHLQAGFVTYFIIAMIGIAGFAYSRVE